MISAKWMEQRLQLDGYALSVAEDAEVVSLGRERKETRLRGRPHTTAYLHLSVCLVIYVRRYSLLKI